VQGIDRVGDLEQDVDERAAFEVFAAKPLDEDREDRQELLPRLLGPTFDLRLEPVLVQSSSRRWRKASTRSSLEAKWR
jgi:hypothetical protein